MSSGSSLPRNRKGYTALDANSALQQAADSPEIHSEAEALDAEPSISALDPHNLKALPDLEENRSEGDEEEGEISIRLCQVGKENRMVKVNPSWTVEQFVQRLFESEFNSGFSVRVIYKGKLLQNSSTLESAGIEALQAIHVSISKHAGLRSAQNANDGDEEQNNDERVAIDPRILEELREMERIAESQYEFNEDGRSQSSNIGEYVLGFTLGYIIGFFMLIWVWQPGVRRRIKAGILLGVTMRLLFVFEEKH